MSLALSLIFVFLTHYIADFLCQTREMANNKSSSVYWLTLHVLTYSIVTSILWGVFLTQDFLILFLVWWTTFLTHWTTDFFTSKGTSYFYKKNNMFGFFSTLGFDQFIHASTLLLTYFYFIKHG